MFRKSPDNLYLSPALARLSWLDHGFGVRESGQWLDGRAAATLKQVHSAIVIEACGPGRLGDGDAMTSDRPGLWIGVKTADCYPVILADERRRVVAVVHSGWRGTAGGIVQEALAAMADRYGTRAHDVVAAVGPGIGGCCYEVGSEVVEQFRRWSGVCLRVPNGGTWRLNLRETLTRQLVERGVPSERVEVAGLCTFCGGEEFCSYRREGGEAGRMVSAAAIRQLG